MTIAMPRPAPLEPPFEYCRSVPIRTSPRNRRPKRSPGGTGVEAPAARAESCLAPDLRSPRGVHDLPAHRGQAVADGVRARVVLGRPGVVPFAHERLNVLRDGLTFDGEPDDVQPEH